MSLHTTRCQHRIEGQNAITLGTLKESSEFLNLLLDHVDAAVLIADENLHIHQFNNSFLDLFDTASNAEIGQSFGQASGCVNAVLENRSCGETSHCHSCLLRRSLIAMLTERVPVDRKRLERVFYMDGEPHLKYLEFSARPIQFQGRRMILVIIYDMTDIETQKRALEDKQKQIELDLIAAAAIQQSLLPQGPPDLSWIRSAWRSTPVSKWEATSFRSKSTRRMPSASTSLMCAATASPPPWYRWQYPSF